MNEQLSDMWLFPTSDSPKLRSHPWFPSFLLPSHVVHHQVLSISFQNPSQIHPPSLWPAVHASVLSYPCCLQDSDFIPLHPVLCPAAKVTSKTVKIDPVTPLPKVLRYSRGFPLHSRRNTHTPHGMQGPSCSGPSLAVSSLLLAWFHLPPS